MSRPGVPDWEPQAPVKVRHTIHWDRFWKLVLFLGLLLVAVALAVVTR